MPLGNVHVHFDRLSSTNEFAIKWLKYYRPQEGTLITTDDQYAGRGQQTAQWISSPNKNLTCSYILYPKFLQIREIYLLNKAICLATAQTIESLTQNSCHIKWPNDIYIGNKKIAGILIQNSIQGKSIGFSIIGIGINVLQDKFPDEINATSLHSHSNELITLEKVIRNLNYHLNNIYGFLQKTPVIIAEQYGIRLLGKHKFMKYKVTYSGEQFEAKTIKVDSTGKIHLEVNSEIRVYAFKEIELQL